MPDDSKYTSIVAWHLDEAKCSDSRVKLQIVNKQLLLGVLLFAESSFSYCSFIT